MTKLSYADFKKNRENYADMLAAELEKQNNKPAQTYEDADDRFWFPTIDDSGNGRALIRFLPNQYDLGKSWVRYWVYNFNGPTGLVYNEKSLVTIGKSDPVAKYNSEQWDAGNEADVRTRKRGVRYVTNIYVIRDPAKPENDGKVKLFRYGPQIQGIIEKVLPFNKKAEKEEKPEEILSEAELEDKVRFIPHDLQGGANFLIKVRPNDEDSNRPKRKGGKPWPTYVDSKFEKPSQFLGGNDEMVGKIFEQTYDLSEFIDPATFKSFEDLEARMKKVLCLDGSQPRAAARPTATDADDLPFDPDNTPVSEEDQKLKELFAKINAG
jgi:hypothetical protein